MRLEVVTLDLVVLFTDDKHDIFYGEKASPCAALLVPVTVLLSCVQFFVLLLFWSPPRTGEV